MSVSGDALCQDGRSDVTSSNPLDSGNVQRDDLDLASQTKDPHHEKEQDHGLVAEAPALPVLHQTMQAPSTPRTRITFDGKSVVLKYRNVSSSMSLVLSTNALA